ncbi:MAG: BlaI/MecI/CopY family transcriptional regulator [Oscillospiraceae bacterium]|nr:BlaI/MecI/CopY family transcriptional regulator [Oscillospiraceae bacterium]MBR0450925.1 BlaI/MecI/CopY family transcriptional regulator [Oscillospiraceae bacterium]MDO5138767.1 BlaI/MecI/CopY family transcriptional regulator [Oscillospiraceae bacterium]
MYKVRLSDMELRFMNIIWSREPVSSPELAKICQNEFGWKKSTTYTVLKRMENKGVLQNMDAVVTSKVAQDEVQREESTRFVEEAFDGSLPQFLTAFLGGKKISKEEAEELKELIDRFME